MAQEQKENIDDLITNANNQDDTQPMVKYLGFARRAPEAAAADQGPNNSCVLFPVPDDKGGLQTVLRELLNDDKRTMANVIIDRLLYIFNGYKGELFQLHADRQLTEYGSYEELLAATDKGIAVLDNLKSLWGQDRGAPADFSYRRDPGNDLFDTIQGWQEDNHCNTLFFNSIFDFECPVAVRGMLEGDSPVTQCRNLYRDAGGDDGQLSAIPRNEGLTPAQKNPDGLANGRDPIWWCIVKDREKTWLRPTTCYICETYLYDTNFEDNDMQCEHFFPFLEAQLLWSLKIPSKISFAEGDEARANMLLNREYGPVCRLCNCNPHKGGKNILSFNPTPTALHPNGSFEINTDTINAIVQNSSKSIGWSVGRPKPTEGGEPVESRILDTDARRERCNAVFKPLKDYVNFDLRYKTKKDIAETMLIRYFYYFNNTTCRKLCAALVDGEDIEKKIRRQEKLLDEFREKDREKDRIEGRISNILKKIKNLIPKKKITLKGIIGTAKNMVRKRTSSRVRALQEAQEKKKTELLRVLRYYKDQVEAEVNRIRGLIDEFNTLYADILADKKLLSELHLDTARRDDFMSRIANLNNDYNNLHKLFNAALERREEGKAQGVMGGGGLLVSPPHPPLTNTPDDYLLLYKIARQYCQYFCHPQGFLIVFLSTLNLIEERINNVNIYYKDIFTKLLDSDSGNSIEAEIGEGSLDNYFRVYKSNKDIVIEEDIWSDAPLPTLLNYFVTVKSEWTINLPQFINELKNETETDLHNSIRKTRENQIKNDPGFRINDVINKANIFMSYFKKLERTYESGAGGLSHRKIYEIVTNQVADYKEGWIKQAYDDDRTRLRRLGWRRPYKYVYNLHNNEIDEAVSIISFVLSKRVYSLTYIENYIPPETYLIPLPPVSSVDEVIICHNDEERQNRIIAEAAARDTAAAAVQRPQFQQPRQQTLAARRAQRKAAARKAAKNAAARKAARDAEAAARKAARDAEARNTGAAAPLQWQQLQQPRLWTSATRKADLERQRTTEAGRKTAAAISPDSGRGVRRGTSTIRRRPRSARPPGLGVSRAWRAVAPAARGSLASIPPPQGRSSTPFAMGVLGTKLPRPVRDETFQMSSQAAKSALTKRRIQQQTQKSREDAILRAELRAAQRQRALAEQRQRALAEQRQRDRNALSVAGRSILQNPQNRGPGRRGIGGRRKKKTKRRKRKRKKKTRRKNKKKRRKKTKIRRKKRKKKTRRRR